MSERTSYVLPGIALVLLGFATGWFLQGARQEVLPQKARSEIPTKTSRINERLRIAIDELATIEDAGAQYEAVERIPPEEMRAYLQALRSRAGLRGLGDRDTALLSTMLAVWHAHSAEDTLTWILAHEDEASRVSLLYRLFESADLSDPVEAMRIAVDNMVSSRSEFAVPTELLQAALAKDPETLLACLRIAQHPRATGHPVVLDFPDGFEFPRFASALADHMADLPKGAHQLVLPGNLVAEWAKEDPTAAFLWASHHPDAATAHGLQASLDAIAESPPNHAGAIFAEALQTEGVDSTLVLDGLATVLHTEANPQILAYFLTSLPSPEQQEAQLLALFRETLRPDAQFRSSRVRHLVLSQMTGEERLAFFDDLLRGPGDFSAPFQLDEEIGFAMRAELARLDHTSEEIATIMDNLAPAPDQPTR